MSRASSSCYRRSTSVKRPAQTKHHAVSCESCWWSWHQCWQSSSHSQWRPALLVLLAHQPHWCYVQGAGAHHIRAHLDSHRILSRLQHGFSVCFSCENTVVDHGARPSPNHQGWWTPNRHSHIGLQQGFRQIAPWETAEHIATVWNTRTNLDVDRGFLWRPHPECHSRWLSLHHSQRHLRKVQS